MEEIDATSSSDMKSKFKVCELCHLFSHDVILLEVRSRIGKTDSREQQTWITVAKPQIHLTAVPVLLSAVNI